MSNPKVSRRKVLVAIGLGAAGAVTAAVAAKDPGPAQSADGKAQPRNPGYHASAHVRRYYRTTRV